MLSWRPIHFNWKALLWCSIAYIVLEAWLMSCKMVDRQQKTNASYDWVSAQLHPSYVQNLNIHFFTLAAARRKCRSVPKGKARNLAQKSYIEIGIFRGDRILYLWSRLGSIYYGIESKKAHSYQKQQKKPFKWDRR